MTDKAGPVERLARGQKTLDSHRCDARAVAQALIQNHL